MLCENCKERQANVKYTQIINGVKKELHLCEKCSKELGINGMDFNMPINFSSFFGDFINDYNENFMPLMSKSNTLQCDKCKMTYDEFVSQGKFGCDHCYEIFSDNIDPILKRLHGSNRYIGRKGIINNCKPTILEKPEEDKKENELTKLKFELKQMIKEEKYEEAAKIRDQIKNIEGNAKEE